MNKTLIGFRATLNGSTAIFDYLQLTGKSSPLIQFISAYVMQVKHWRFTEMEKLHINSTGEKGYTASLSFTFQDGRIESFEVMLDELNRFFVKEEQSNGSAKG